MKAKAAPKAKKAAAPKPAPKKATQAPTKPKPKTASKKRAKPDPEDEDEDEDDSLQDPSLHDDSLLSATPPSAKKQKKAPAPKKAGGKPLTALQNDASVLDGSVDVKPVKGSTDKYQKVRHLVLDSSACFNIQ